MIWMLVAAQLGNVLWFMSTPHPNPFIVLFDLVGLGIIIGLAFLMRRTHFRNQRRIDRRMNSPHEGP